MSRTGMWTMRRTTVSKGSNRRPTQVERTWFDKEWDRIFGGIVTADEPEVYIGTDPAAPGTDTSRDYSAPEDKQ